MRQANNLAIPEEYSDRLSSLRFPLIVGVVFIHAYGFSVLYSNKAIGINSFSNYLIFFQNLISQGVGRIAVPMFFLLSGYFFFINFKFSTRSFFNKLSSRCKTLLVPFLFWNITTLVALWAVQAFPVTLSFFPDKSLVIRTYETYDYFKAIFGIDRFPIAYQFWFVRDLMMLVVLVPVLNLLLKVIPTFSLCLVGGAWFFSVWSLEPPSITALSFFYLGAYLAHFNKNLFSLDKYGNIILIGYIAILFFDTYFITSPYHPYLHRAGLLLGIISAFYLTSYLVFHHKAKSLLLYASVPSFFVFAIHEPLLTVVKKISYIVFEPTTEVVVLALYLAIPLSVVGFSLLIYYACLFLFPQFLRVVSGGR